MYIKPIVRDAIEAAAAAVNNHLGRRFPSYADDIVQEARLAGLEAAARFQADVGSPEAYFYRIMICSVAPQIHRWISVTSISREMARLGLAGSSQHREPVEDGAAWSPPGQEDPALRREAEREVVQLRVRWRREVERATRRLDPETRACGALALGLDGPRLEPRQIALELGLWRDEVEVNLNRFRRRLKTPVIRLERQVLVAEARLP